MGYLLSLRMRVQRIKPIVQLTKTWYTSAEAFVEALGKASAADAQNDFVDGVALSTTGGVVLEGKFVDSCDNSKIADYSWSSGRQFYRSILHEGVEHLKVDDYIWRWDADWFWCTQIFPGLGLWLIRFLCGPDLLRSDNYKLFNDKFTQWIPKFVNGDEELVIQDIMVPAENGAEWIKTHCRIVPSHLCGKIKLWRSGWSATSTVPIWLCPVRSTKAPFMPMKINSLYINFGFWDALQDQRFTKGGNSTGRVNRALEDACPSVGAVKTLYSSSYYSKEEFYRIYNGSEYQKLKAKYDPGSAFRGWYERILHA